MANRGLGRGLDALIPQIKSKDTNDILENRIVEVPLSKIVPNKNQPRHNFNDQSLSELAASIKEFGIIQPIAIRSLDRGGMYEIISGERRYKAAKMLNLNTIPCIVNQNIDDISSLEMALIENIQRDNLTQIELSHTFRQLIDEFKLTHEELSQRVGKSRAAITNSLRLLLLPVEIQKLIDNDSISAGHARALLSLSRREDQIEIANLIIERDLSVREVERIVNKKESPPKTKKDISDSILQFEKLPEVIQAISDYLNTPVRIKIGKKKGRIEILFGSVKGFERIVNQIIGK